MKRQIAAIGFAAIAFGAAVLAATPLAAQTMQGQMKMADPETPADKAFVGAMRDMMVGMHENMPTGDTDNDFVRMMLPHHQAAVDMAKAELQYGNDPELKTLAQNIVNAQDKEIAMMKDWEAKHPR